MRLVPAFMNRQDLARDARATPFKYVVPERARCSEG
jgi:hypothetical protein